MSSYLPHASSASGLAQDVLSPAEEAVYDTLWGVRGGPRDERESYRIAQAGYDYLMKRTRLSKKTIQRIVSRLIDKGFIAIDKPADIYQRTSTVYRVFTYRAVLDRQVQQGRFHVAKIGPGFLYVREMAPPANLSTVVESNMATVVNATTVTGVKSDLSTVVNVTTIKIEHNLLEQSSSSSSEIREMKACLRAIPRTRRRRRYSPIAGALPETRTGLHRGRDLLFRGATRCDP